MGPRGLGFASGTEVTSGEDQLELVGTAEPEVVTHDRLADVLQRVRVVAGGEPVGQRREVDRRSAFASEYIGWRDGVGVSRL